MKRDLETTEDLFREWQEQKHDILDVDAWLREKVVQARVRRMTVIKNVPIMMGDVILGVAFIDQDADKICIEVNPTGEAAGGQLADFLVAYSEHLSISFTGKPGVQIV